MARVAVLATTWFVNSHADVLIGPLLDGYEVDGQRQHGLEVASLYVEQLGVSGEYSEPRPDIGLAAAQEHSVPWYATVAEALGCGRPGINVDGVLIIAEHGDYEKNEYGQKLYPRRRLFDAVVATMVSASRFIPVYIDKHLAWSHVDAMAMYSTARRLGIPVLAGSTLPLAWREPAGAEWPLGTPMSEMVVLGSGDVEDYGFHMLELGQTFAERRAAAETGVRQVRALSGRFARQAYEEGAFNSGLLDECISALPSDRSQQAKVLGGLEEMFLVEYMDGLRLTVVNCSGHEEWVVCCDGGGHRLVARAVLGGPPDFSHFILMLKQIEDLVSNGRAPTPLERTLLTTGVLDAAMRSRSRAGAEVDTPYLSVCYEPPKEGSHQHGEWSPESQPRRLRKGI